jgi:hypothetical protein
MNTISMWSLILATIVLAPHGIAQCQRQKLLAADAQIGDTFGFSVAISGDWAAVASPLSSDQINGSGAVYVFQEVGSTWVQRQKLKANDASLGALFGYSIAMSGTVLVIGAPEDFGVGATYVFELAGSTWTQTAKLNASNPNAGDAFGVRVATTGDRILMSAPGDDQHGQDAGAAYVFDRVGTAWVQSAKLMGNDTVAFNSLGTVSLSGDRAILGTTIKAGPGGAEQGAAYVFEKGMTGWTQTQKLLASDGASYDHFGNSVAVLGTRIVVGAAGRTHGSAGAGGTAYAYEYNGSAWALTQEFWADDTVTNDFFGGMSAIALGHIIIEAGNGGGDTGSAYDFRPSGSTWIQAGKLLADDAAWGDILGTGLAADGDRVIAGAPGRDDACSNNPTCESGAAYIFQLAPTATQYGHCPTGAPCNNIDIHGGCANSTGQGAILAACGSGSVTTDDLQIEVTHCPAHKSTLLFMGGTQVIAPYADGIRVVGGGPPGIYRFGIIQSDANGMAMRGPGLVAQSQGFHSNGRIQAGQVWNFQVWYRDLAGPCGHFTNYSNGVQVAFAP